MMDVMIEKIETCLRFGCKQVAADGSVLTAIRELLAPECYINHIAF